MTGLQNINASDLLFTGNHHSVATLIVTRGTTQTRWQGDACGGNVRRKLKALSPITDLRAAENTTQMSFQSDVGICILTPSPNLIPVLGGLPLILLTEARLRKSYNNVTAKTLLLYFKKRVGREQHCKHVKGWSRMGGGAEWACLTF